MFSFHLVKDILSGAGRLQKFSPPFNLTGRRLSSAETIQCTNPSPQSVLETRKGVGENILTCFFFNGSMVTLEKKR